MLIYFFIENEEDENGELKKFVMEEKIIVIWKVYVKENCFNWLMILYVWIVFVWVMWCI